jgi:hypothetical protein
MFYITDLEKYMNALKRDENSFTQLKADIEIQAANLLKELNESLGQRNLGSKWDKMSHKSYVYITLNARKAARIWDKDATGK